MGVVIGIERSMLMGGMIGEKGGMNEMEERFYGRRNYGLEL